MRFVGIDPSTKTGFVALDKSGQVVRAKELTGVGKEDPKRMITLIDEVTRHVNKNDFIVIEGFGFSSVRAIQTGGIGWGVRMALARNGLKYIEVAPNALKKFVNVTGWVGETGSKRRLKNNEKKQAVMDAVNDHFGFTHGSDNVVDAYVLAQIAKSLYEKRVKTQYQKEVIETILNPPPKKRKKVKK